jgi:hypothetical protein
MQVHRGDDTFGSGGSGAGTIVPAASSFWYTSDILRGKSSNELGTIAPVNVIHSMYVHGSNIQALGLCAALKRGVLDSCIWYNTEGSACYHALTAQHALQQQLMQAQLYHSVVQYSCSNRMLLYTLCCCQSGTYTMYYH